MREEHRYLCWLCSVPGLYYQQRSALLQAFGSAAAVFGADGGSLSLLEKETGLHLQGIKRYNNEDFLVRNEEKLAAAGISFTAPGDPDYPERLTNIPDAPHGLFIRGKIPKMPAASSLTASVVGARGCSAYGLTMAEQIGEALGEAGIPVISGMAEGIDAAAQCAALRAGASSIAVLGCGVDICYPSSSRALYGDLLEHGCILSEYPCGARPLALHFPFRNRIISGLSDILVVIEAREKSGSLITADYALEQGKDVYALPGRCMDDMSRGTNRLISQGAGIILSASEFVKELQSAYPDRLLASGELPGGKHKKKVALAWDEELVYSFLDLLPVRAEDVALRSGLKVPAVQSALLRLELKEVVRRAGPNQFVKQQ